MANDPYGRLLVAGAKKSVEVSRRRIARAEERIGRAAGRLVDSQAAGEASLACLSLRRHSQAPAGPARVRQVLQTACVIRAEVRESIRVANALVLETREIVARIRASRGISKPE